MKISWWNQPLFFFFLALLPLAWMCACVCCCVQSKYMTHIKKWFHFTWTLIVVHKLPMDFKIMHFYHFICINPFRRREMCSILNRVQFRWLNGVWQCTIYSHRITCNRFIKIAKVTPYKAGRLCEFASITIAINRSKYFTTSQIQLFKVNKSVR